jgi:uncharacterized protein YbjT (DUF2867 family)
MMMDLRSTRTPPILVTGGSGTLGRHVVARLRDAGRAVRVLSRVRQEGQGIEFVTGDLATGDGVEEAVAGIDVVVHLAGSARGDGEKARHLVAAAAPAGVGHIVYISVVGADRIPMAGAVDRAMFGYFGEKLAAERVIAAAGIPWTTLRATQFYDLSLLTAQAMARLPVMPIPAGFRFQPVEADEVAQRLVELAQGRPTGLVPPIAGPRVYDWADLVRAYLRAAGKRRAIIRVPVPGRAAAAVRAGMHLAPEHAVGRRTWEAFLAERVGSPAGSRSLPSAGSDAS